jgi:hypothetical protein
MLKAFIKWFKETFKSVEQINLEWQQEREKINRHFEIHRLSREITEKSNIIHQNMVRSEAYIDSHPVDSKKWKRINDREQKKMQDALKLKNWNDGTDITQPYKK